MKWHFLASWFSKSRFLVYLLFCDPVAAQIIPDATLPVNSRVQQQGNTSLIEGGTTVGENLFHSFESFSVPTGGAAFFNNATDIQTIFSRVTGSSLSHIDGLIRANGIASLFLINPQGIIFGPNAQLDLGGSFLVSTASRIRFADGLEFSATHPHATALLSINVPIGLQYGTNPGAILVQGPGHQMRQTQNITEQNISTDRRPDGLRVQEGQTLAIAGGEVRLQGGNLTAKEGRIEVGSVDSGSEVAIAPTHPGWRLAYDKVPNFRDITLVEAASLDVSGSGSGTIQIQGRRLTLKEGSLIFAFKTGSNPAGSIAVRTTESVEAIGASSPLNDSIASGLLALVTENGTGIGGSILIETRRLILQEGGQIGVSTIGKGRGSTLTIKASELVEISGTQANPNFPSGLFTNVQPGVTGDGGDLTIETGRLILREGGVVAAGTFSTGNSGNVTVKASESVEVLGFKADRTSVSGLVAHVFLENTTGNGGNLAIETKRLIVREGGLVTVGTFGRGNSGNLTIKASESVELRGTLPDGTVRSGLYSGTLTDRATGAAGDVTLETGRLILQDKATITASSESLKPAGRLSITARSIELSDLATISADTRAGGGSIELRSPALQLRNSSITTNAKGGESGGNIEIQGQLLQLRDNSTIATNASGSNTTGGNINFNLEGGTLVALENSDITANAEQSRGGKIAIKADAIFGSVPRTREELQRLLNTTDASAINSRNLLTSDITAISQQGGPQLQGNVTVNTPDVDPSSGLVDLPVDLVDPTRLITTGCPVANENSFTITGRGGVPLSPIESLRPNHTVSVDWITSDRGDESRNSDENLTSRPLTHERLVEATGWIVNERNQVVLTASTPRAMVNSFGTPPEACTQPSY